ncbi:hypothetical protein QUF80_00575 [Desulfococcaceae bacterium HSG8]|nr:hypothetical protein [Desulfococcaceae bacterium HSG8]
MKDNATIKEIRETRKRISERFGHNPKRLVEYYKKKQLEKTELDKSRKQAS